MNTRYKLSYLFLKLCFLTELLSNVFDVNSKANINHFLLRNILKIIMQKNLAMDQLEKKLNVDVIFKTFNR